MLSLHALLIILLAVILIDRPFGIITRLIELHILPAAALRITLG